MCVCATCQQCKEMKPHIHSSVDPWPSQKYHYSSHFSVHILFTSTVRQIALISRNIQFKIEQNSTFIIICESVCRKQAIQIQDYVHCTIQSYKHSNYAIVNETYVTPLILHIAYNRKRAARYMIVVESLAAPDRLSYAYANWFRTNDSFALPAELPQHVFFQFK